MADNDKAVLIGYVLIDQLQDKGTKGIVESGKDVIFNNGTSSYKAKFGCVIVGRKHTGDENGLTYYLTGKPKIFDVDLRNEVHEVRFAVFDRHNSDSFKQSNLNFTCEGNNVIVGRTHTGDENGFTTFVYAELAVKKVNLIGKYNYSIGVVEPKDSLLFEESIKIAKESNGEWALSKLGEYYLPMVAMSHSGDENGTSTYGFKLFGIYREPISKD
ncbi:hypothetical protein KTQ96_11665 [Prevotella copri]|mgnify:FL=1|uniref:Uncharacterized protein n=2 Tax=Segatella TaxID=2974251 RepID=A0AAW4N184_9BACT|nr:hypothetical protein [Segatella copri]MBU9908586.1 hypothetical protein [Segatella copri]MBV3374081.1 hypothetical protein [Segatella copri]MBV3387800.1 hypothetical protein [Segatella copri]MBV3396910.1 hypothetical protein [Segatella copri]MBV3405325.1 hypothetical protein [Segatella copri]